MTTSANSEETVRLIRIETKIDRALDLITDTRDDVKDHEARIRSLEKMVYKAAGMAALVGAGGASVVQQFLT